MSIGSPGPSADFGGWKAAEANALGERYAQQHGGDDSEPPKRDGPLRRMIARVRAVLTRHS